MSQFYPEILTGYVTIVSRFVNHLCILQQEIIVKPMIQMAYSKGLKKYIPFLEA